MIGGVRNIASGHIAKGLVQLGLDVITLGSDAAASVVVNEGLSVGADVLGDVAVEEVAGQAAEGAAKTGGRALHFTQTTASPWFSNEGSFSGQTISDVAAKLRSGALTTADVPVTLVGDGLIVNTRSSLALMQAGIPQSQWTLIQGGAQDAANIAARLSRNGLGPTGTDVLRITGSGKDASTLIGSGTIPPPGP